MRPPVDDGYQSPNLPEIEFNVAEFWRDVDSQMSTD
jgi:hypothetical protein